MVTDLDPKKRAPAIALTLDGRKRDVAMEISLAELNDTDGMEKLMDKLQSVFDVHGIDKAFSEYAMFESFQRNTTMSIREYVIQFDRNYQRIKQSKMVLPDNVLACKLLYSANLDIKERQMVFASTTTFAMESMKSTLIRIFSDRPPSSPDVIKEEPAFVAESTEQAFFTGKFRRGFRGRFAQPRPYMNRDRRPRGRNPTNSRGEMTTCNLCGSFNHWASKCPDRETDEKSSSDRPDVANKEQVYLTFVTIQRSLLNHCWHHAILDTACTSTVAGVEWLNDYVEKLEGHNRTLVSKGKSTSRIVFGGNNSVSAISEVQIPVQMGEMNCLLTVQAIPGTLPLLLSVNSMIKAGAVINLDENCISLHGCSEKIPLLRLPTGHIAINLLPKGDLHNESLVLTAIKDLDQKDITKLHRQFSHCREERLTELLAKAGHESKAVKDLVRQVCSSCEVCVRYGRAPARPIVSLPLSNHFNDVISLDLHELREIGHSVYYIHIIDLFTRFSQAGIIYDKKGSTIVSSLNKLWCFTFGVPNTILTDNGGEFCNEEFRTNAENLDIKLLNSPAESPWSNGVVERHNQVLTETFLKARENCVGDEICLQQSVFAKNCLTNTFGFSPYQLVYGRLPNIPNVMTHRLPALCNTTSSEIVRTHLGALNAARKAFMEAECSGRIKTALHRNIRRSNLDIGIGDRVYFQRRTKQWRGPGTVLGFDGPTTIVKYNGSVFKVHRNQLRPTELAHVQADGEQPTGDTTTTKAGTSERCDESSELTTGHLDETEVLNPQPTESDEESSVNNRQTSQGNEPTNIVSNADVKQTETVCRKVSNPPTEAIKRNTQLSIKSMELSEPVSASVVSRAGKASGKFKSWYNLRVDEPESRRGEVQSVNMDAVEEWAIIDGQDARTEAVFSCMDARSMAMADEITSWMQNDVFDPAKRTFGQNCVETRWVISEKPDGRIKARLVAKGFQDADKDEVVKESPTCGRDHFRVILSLFASIREWTACEILDVKTAFLQGLPISRNIFIVPPKEANEAEDCLWKLKKCVYGLTDASRHWYERVRAEFESLGGVRSVADPAIFLWSDQGVIATHVDDFWIAGTRKFVDEIVPKLQTIFVIGTRTQLPCVYLGMEIGCNGTSLCMGQNKYISDLVELPQSAESCDRPLTTDEKTALRTILGKLLWIGVQTRPDILVSNFLHYWQHSERHDGGSY